MSDFAVIGMDGWMSPKDPPDNDRPVQLAWDDMSFGNSFGFYDSKAEWNRKGMTAGQKIWWTSSLVPLQDGAVGAWREIP